MKIVKKNQQHILYPKGKISEMKSVLNGLIKLDIVTDKSKNQEAYQLVSNAFVNYGTNCSAQYWGVRMSENKENNFKI